MRLLAEARADVLAAMPAMAATTVGLSDALGRVTSEPVVADQEVPPFANSAMDGFAVRFSDIEDAPVDLLVIEDVPAGSVPTVAVESGQATRIMTGAPMPDGADTVVMVEATEPVDGGSVAILEAPREGANVRPAGGDVAPGDVLVEAGVRLDPRHLGAIATVRGSVAVGDVPTVAILSTGDEVVPPDTNELGPGMIRDTNRTILDAALRESGDDFAELRLDSTRPGAAPEAQLVTPARRASESNVVVRAFNSLLSGMGV